MTPLHLAVISDQVGVARLLLKAGASLRVMDDYGRTPLDYFQLVHGNQEPNKSLMNALLSPYAFVDQFSSSVVI